MNKEDARRNYYLSLHQKTQIVENMKDEFTTMMHADMLGWSKEDAMLIESYAQILKGIDKAEVCRKHGFTVEYYDDNIEGALRRC